MFTGCGWNTCSSWSIFNKRPAAEYKIWVASVFERTHPVDLTSQDKCFGDLISLKYNKETRTLEHPKGLRVSWQGNTQGTAESQKSCGVDAIQELVFDFASFFTCQVLGYSHILYVMESMGYQTGLTFQAVPYDFRFASYQSETQKTVPAAINHMYSMTGKRSILVAFSYGNLPLIEAISKLSQQEKEQKIKQVILVGPPLTGVVKSLMSMLGGDKDYVQKVLGNYVGISLYSQIKLAETSSIDDMLPKNIFERFANESWLEEVKKRKRYENGEQNFDKQDIPFGYIFPNKEEICVSDIFEDRKDNKHCMMDIMNTLEEPIAEINGKKFYAKNSDLEEIFNNHVIIDKERGLGTWKESLTAQGLNGFLNPQVPIAIIFGSHINTQTTVKYEQDTRKHFEETKNFYFPDNQNIGSGDGTVNTYSAILPGLKWAHEFQFKKAKGAKPIKLVNYCSIHQQSTTFYEEEGSQGRFNSKNQYQGLRCQCEDGVQMKNCMHACIINDKYVTELIIDALKTHEKSTLTNQKQYNKQDLENLQNECPALK